MTLQPLTGSKQHELMPLPGSKQHELMNRPPALRGDDARPHIAAMHAAAEKRVKLQRKVKTQKAKKHNAEVKTVVAESKALQASAAKVVAANLERQMSDAAERHEQEIAKVRAKGNAEVQKVEMANVVSAEQQRQAIQQKYMRMQQSMHAHAERRSDEVANRRAIASKETAKAEAAAARLALKEVETLSRGAAHVQREVSALLNRELVVANVRAKAHAAVDRVVDAVAAREDATEEARDALDNAMNAAAQRRAVALDKKREKASAEGAKVARVTPPKASSHATGKLGGPPSPDSVMVSTSAFEGGAADADAASEAKRAAPFDPRDVGALLKLMRAGVPNSEVLVAVSAEDFAALAMKYGVAG